MRAIIKGILLFLNIFICIGVLTVTRSILVLFTIKRKFLVSYIVHLFGKIFTLILGIKVKVSGEKSLLKKRGVLFVSNHLSYIDGIVMTSLSPLVFIGRSDLRFWPLFGLFSFLSYTIFVNRNSPLNIQKEIGRIVSFLKDKVNVVLFPEGTSSEGTRLLAFRSSFFVAPLEAKSPTVCLAIKYKKINSEDINDKNKDLVYWYGDMNFFPHLLGVLKLEEILVEVNVCGALEDLEIKDKSTSLQRKYLCDACQKVIEYHLGYGKSPSRNGN